MKTIQVTEQLTVFQSVLFQTNASLVQLEDFVLLVDPCWFHTEIAAIRQYVDKILDNRKLYLLFTHSDYDHILGYHYFKEATVICSEAFDQHPDKEERLGEISKFCEAYYLSRDEYALEYPKGDLVVRDGEVLTLGETKLHFYTAPGHTADGLYTFLEPLGIFIAGDYLSDLEFPLIYDSFASFSATMEKTAQLVNKHQPKIMVQGHGSFAQSTTEMLARVKDSQTYLQELKSHLLEGKNFDLKGWMERYAFPSSLEVEHVKNLKVVRAEFGV